MFYVLNQNLRVCKFSYSKLMQIWLFFPLLCSFPKIACDYAEIGKCSREELIKIINGNTV